MSRQHLSCSFLKFCGFFSFVLQGRTSKSWWQQGDHEPVIIPLRQGRPWASWVPLGRALPADGRSYPSLLSLGETHLESWVQCWSHQYQRHSSTGVKSEEDGEGLGAFVYKETLRELRLLSLGKRGLRGDLINAYKYLDRGVKKTEPGLVVCSERTAQWKTLADCGLSLLRGTQNPTGYRPWNRPFQPQWITYSSSFLKMDWKV